MSCIFCSIYQSSNTFIIYQSNHTFVIKDRFPISKGHLLVIPKVHHPSLHEYEDEEVSDILSVCKKMINKYKLEKYNILQNNGNFQSVYHVHFHIIPCNNEEERLKINWTTLQMDDEEFKDYVKE